MQQSAEHTFPIGFVIIKRDPFLSRVIMDASELIETVIAEVHDLI
jgi:hypothetical protein